MAIEFVQEKNKNKKLLWILGAVITVIAAIWGGFYLWNFISERQTEAATTKPVPYPEIKVNFSFLENNFLLKKMVKFERIAPFEGTAGRENPFTP